jgi:hypothetical protein
MIQVESMERRETCSSYNFYNFCTRILLLAKLGSCLLAIGSSEGFWLDFVEGFLLGMEVGIWLGVANSFWLCLADGGWSGIKESVMEEYFGFGPSAFST